MYNAQDSGLQPPCFFLSMRLRPTESLSFHQITHFIFYQWNLELLHSLVLDKRHSFSRPRWLFWLKEKAQPFNIQRKETGPKFFTVISVQRSILLWFDDDPRHGFQGCCVVFFSDLSRLLLTKQHHRRP